MTVLLVNPSVNNSMAKFDRLRHYYSCYCYRCCCCMAYFQGYKLHLPPCSRISHKISFGVECFLPSRSVYRQRYTTSLAIRVTLLHVNLCEPIEALQWTLLSLKSLAFHNRERGAGSISHKKSSPAKILTVVSHTYSQFRYT